MIKFISIDNSDITPLNYISDNMSRFALPGEKINGLISETGGTDKDAIIFFKLQLTIWAKGLFYKCTDTFPTFDGTYNASTNKAATVSTVTEAIQALNGNLNDTTPEAGKTLTGFSQTDGVVSATFGDISITKSQVSDFPTLGTAAAKNFTTSVNSSSTDDTVPTSKAVWSAIASGIAANDAMVYKGTIDGGNTGTYGALTGAANKGETYKVSLAGKINGIAVEVGDMLICNTDNTAAATNSNFTTIASNWDIIQTNIDGAVTGPSSSIDNHIAVFNGTNGKIIKDSGYTILTSVPSNAVFTDTKYKFTIGNTTNGDSSGTSLGSLKSEAAASSGTNLSLVTTGEKYTWNNKLDALTFTSTPSSTNKVVTLNDVPSTLPANGGNAATVNNHSVNSDVPANAKFTDTTYKFTIGTDTKGDSTNGVDLGTLKSETAASGGATLSLVTTGDKYNWNHMLDWEELN